MSKGRLCSHESSKRLSSPTALSPMPNPDLKNTLRSTREIEIEVTGRKSGRKISLPVWFVQDAGQLLLLPVNGSDTNWFRNVEHTPSMTIRADKTITLPVRPSYNSSKIREVVEKFRTKYGAGDVKKYYTKFDACVEISLP